MENREVNHLLLNPMGLLKIERGGHREMRRAFHNEVVKAVLAVGPRT